MDPITDFSGWYHDLGFFEDETTTKYFTRPDDPPEGWHGPFGRRIDAVRHMLELMRPVPMPIPRIPRIPRITSRARSIDMELL